MVGRIMGGGKLLGKLEAQEDSCLVKAVHMAQTKVEVEEHRIKGNV